MTPENKAKMDAIVARDGADVVMERLRPLFESAKVQGELDRKSDTEIADLLTHAEMDMDMFSPLCMLLGNAAERLRRSGGGPTGDDEAKR